jgi:hypothetical protein
VTATHAGAARFTLDADADAYVDCSYSATLMMPDATALPGHQLTTHHHGEADHLAWPERPFADALRALDERRRS